MSKPKGMMIAGRVDLTLREFSVEVSQPLGWSARRSLNLLFGRPEAFEGKVWIVFEKGQQPCDECYAALTDELLAMFGSSARLSPRQSRLVVEYNIHNRRRHDQLRGVDFGKTSQIAQAHLDHCKASGHTLNEPAA